MEQIQSKDQFARTIQSDGLTVVKFETTWCPDCKNLNRFIDPIVAEQHDKHFYAIDADQFQDIADAYEVRGIPSLLVYRNGEKIAHLHSKFAKTPDQIRQFLNALQ